MRERLAWLAPTLVLLVACRGPAQETKRSAEPVASAATTASTTSDAGAPLVVRIHRWGGAPGGLNHTLEVHADASARLTGYDSRWCTIEQNTRLGPRNVNVDTRGLVEPDVFAELRALVSHPEVTRFAGANGPARAPASDGVAAEITLPPQAPVLIDGLQDVKGKMARLLTLERELAKRLGVPAACL